MEAPTDGSPTGLRQERRTAPGLSISEAALAIRNLDRHAFPGTLCPEEGTGRTALRVADVLAATSRRTAEGMKQPQFSKLSGFGQLHRERARQRKRTVSAAVREKDDARRASSQRSSTYRPFSLSLLLKRLSTFSISTYSNKPDSVRLLSPLGMAMLGWSHGQDQARDEVQCDTCAVRWKVEVPAVGTKEDQEREWEKIEQCIQTRHEAWCPWRIRSCSPSLYRLPIRSVLETQAELGNAAKELTACAGIGTINISTDLPESDLRRLSDKYPSVPLPALTLALLGWKPAEGSKPVQQCIIICQMCARRAGLWSYAQDASPPRAFDAIREHKSYCPLVNGHVQSGRWLQEGRESDLIMSPIVKAPSPAWALRLQLLLGNSSLEARTDHTEDQQGIDMRSMRSHEILAKVKGLLDGYPS